MEIAEQRISVGSLEWFYREALPLSGQSDQPTVVLLHGLVSQGYSWRGVLPTLAEQGLRAIAPDWIGHGFSTRAEPQDFAYTPEAFVEALGDFIDALELEQIHLVVQGFLGSHGLLYALANPDRIARLVIINAPLSPAAKLPWKIRKMALPLAGEVMTQAPLLVDRTLEGGGPYQVDDEDLDIYRRPFLQESVSGRALLATKRKLQLAKTTADIEAGLKTWQQPTLLLWGIADPWLPVALAEDWVKALPNGTLTSLEEVGHYAQEDWAEKVATAIAPFLRQTVAP